MKKVFVYSFSVITLFCFQSLFGQNIEKKVWYDLERKHINEIYYIDYQTDGKIFNQRKESSRIDFFSLNALGQYSRFEKYDLQGNIIAIAEVDSIKENDSRARFSILKTLIGDNWSESRTQENSIQENWRFYSYERGKKELVRERIIEYYSRNGTGFKGISNEIEHFASSKDSLYNKNLDSLRNCDGLFTKYVTFSFNEKKVVLSPNILWQGAILNGENVGTSKEYFPYSGELARIVTYKKGKLKRVECYSYFIPEIGIANERPKNKNYTNTYQTSVYSKNKVYIYNVEGNLINKRKKKLNDKIPFCQCDNAYFDRAYYFIEEEQYIKPFLDKNGVSNYEE